MPTVPSWIAKAIIVRPIIGSPASLMAIKDWRATKTQVIVTSETGQERRFYLDTLTEVGQSKSFPLQRNHLAAPDAPEVLHSRRMGVLNRARYDVMDAIEKARLQETTVDPGVLLAKLEAIRMAVTQGQASLADVL